MKRLIILVLLATLSGCAAQSSKPVIYGATRSVTEFPTITPASNDYWILSDTSASGAFGRVLTSNVRAALGLATTDAPVLSAANMTHKNNITTKTTAADYTIGTTDPEEAYGGIIYVTAAATVTAPAIAAGQNYCVVTVGDVAVSLDVDASDKMILDGVTLADGEKATNSSKSDDIICCAYYSADGQSCHSGTVLGGHWTNGH